MQGHHTPNPNQPQGEICHSRRLLQTSNHCSLLERGEVTAGEVYDSTNRFQEESGCASPNSLDHAHSTLLLSTCSR